MQLLTKSDLPWVAEKIRLRLALPWNRARARFKDRLDRLRNVDPPITFSPLPWSKLASPPGCPEYLKIIHKNSKNKIWSKEANDIRDHNFEIYGKKMRAIAPEDNYYSRRFVSLTADLPNKQKSDYKPIEWHSDLNSGYRWSPDQFYLDVRWKVGNGVDIKIPRELSRFQHIGVLNNAPIEEAGIEFILQVLDWIAANPLRRGVNWACTMDVALRVINWMWGLRLFEPVLQRYPKSLSYLTRSIYQHGIHIENNLDYYEECTSNHYLSDIAGLLYIGAVFPQFPESDRWLLFALQELVSEMDREVYADGGAHEASTYYHRLIAELFLSCAAIAERIPFARRIRLGTVNRLKHKVKPRLQNPKNIGLNLFDDAPLLPPTFYERLTCMIGFTNSITKPNGLVPQFGDNDSGRVHMLFPWSNRENRKHAHLSAVAAELFDRTDLRALCPESARKEGRLIAGDLRGRVHSTKVVYDFNEGVQFFKNTGIAVIKNESAWLAVTCGPNGMNGRGGHGHNDKNSFELNIYGADFIVDGGCPAYSSSPELRNRYRGTWAHSTVAVTGKEQDPIATGLENLFQLPEKCEPTLIVKPDKKILGSHKGYGAQHLRSFRMTDTKLKIKDTLNILADRWLIFNLDPLVNVQDVVSRGTRIKCNLRHRNGIVVILTVDGAGDAHIGEGCFGLGYGIPVSNQNLKFRMLRSEIITTISWNP